MPKKTKTKRTSRVVPIIEIAIPTDAIVIESMDDAVEALAQMEDISSKIAIAQSRCVDLKREVTDWAVKKRVGVIQLDDHYYRQIQRTNRGWDVDKLQEIIGDATYKVKGKSKKVWNYITKRTLDTDKLDLALKKGYVDEDEIESAFVEKTQAPFLQMFPGEAADA